MAKTVLVTGASGFLGQHVVLQLLDKGYRVRGTARSQEKVDASMAVFAEHASSPSIDFVLADLSTEAGWDAAVTGCDYVVHTASPIPASLPKDENELILPAREGTLRVLKNAAEAGVKRVVLTSSAAAVMYGRKTFERPLDETSWTDPADKKRTSSYIRSKTLAEQAAWAFVDESGSDLELVTIQPSLILGPALSKNASASLEVVTQPLNGQLPAVPKIGFEIVDVRDVASLHILALEHPDAAGERFIASDARLSFLEVCDILRNEYPEQAKRIPSRSVPSFLLRLLAVFNPPLKQVLLEIDVVRRVSSRKARDRLGWTTRPAQEAVLSAARSAIEYGLVRG